MAAAYPHGSPEPPAFQGDMPGNWPYDERVQDLVRHLRQQLEDVSRQQRQLANAREKLLMKREQLRACGKILRTQREKTGRAEEVFMTSVRRFYSDQEGRPSLPSHIQEQYRLMEQARDELGEAEDEWMQTDRQLGGEEWDFSDKEAMFYRNDVATRFSDEFFDSILRRPRSPQQQPHVPEHAFAVRPDYQAEYDTEHLKLQALRKEFNSMRDQQAQYLEKRRSHKLLQRPLSLLPKQDPVFMSRYEQLLTDIAETEVKVQQLKQKVMETDSLTHVLKRRASEPLTPGPPKTSLSGLKRAQTDGGLSTLDNPDVRSRIREWLLDYLRNNTIEKTQYREILKSHGAPDLDEESWQEAWDVDMSEHFSEDEEDYLHGHSVSRSTTDLAGIMQDIYDDEIGNDEVSEMAYNTKLGLDFEGNFNYAPLPPPPSPPVAHAPLPIASMSSVPPYPLYEIDPYFDSETESDAPLEMIPYYASDTAETTVNILPPHPLPPLYLEPAPRLDFPHPQFPTYPDEPARLTVPETFRHDSHHGSEASPIEYPQRTESIGDYSRDDGLIPMESEVERASSAPLINIVDVSAINEGKGEDLEKHPSSEDRESMDQIETVLDEPVISENPLTQGHATDGVTISSLNTAFEQHRPTRGETLNSRFVGQGPPKLHRRCSSLCLSSPSVSTFRARPRSVRPKSDGSPTPSKKRSIEDDHLARRRRFAEYITFTIFA
jgi:hypothetical protein